MARTNLGQAGFVLYCVCVHCVWGKAHDGGVNLDRLTAICTRVSRGRPNTHPWRALPHRSYVIALRRQPLNDATLTNIKLELGAFDLTPPFEPRIVEYSSSLPGYATSVAVACTREDKLIGVTVNGTAGLTKKVDLQGGETVITIETMAADKTTIGCYRITV
jgi:hypothetical protein